MSYLMSERHFRRHEAYIATIINAYPNLTTFDVRPPITQSEILARNIRYAGKSMQECQWASTTINAVKFMQVWDDVTVSTTVQPGKVVCGPEEFMKHTVSITPLEAMAPQVCPAIHVDHPTIELITAIFVFHHHRYLSEPSTIITDNAELIKQLTAIYDVAVTQDGNRYTIL